MFGLPGAAPEAQETLGVYCQKEEKADRGRWAWGLPPRGRPCPTGCWEAQQLHTLGICGLRNLSPASSSSPTSPGFPS